MRASALSVGLLVCLALIKPASAQMPPPPTEPPAPAEPTPTPTQPAPRPEPRIAAGVSVAGVDVGGLTVADAAAKLAATLGPRLRKPIEVRVARRRFELTARRVRLRFDAPASARRAYRAGRRMKPGDAPPDVRPIVHYRRREVRLFAAHAAALVYLAPRNAKLHITVRRMVVRRSYYGRRLDKRWLGRRLRRTLVHPRARRVLRPRRRRIRPAIRLVNLKRRYRTVLTIDRGSFTLRLFKRLRYDRSYPIAVGAAGYETPGGLRRVLSKQVNPAWHAPNRPWAGSYAGRTVPGGAPNNPLKARWLGLGGGVGIHGTSESWSIGTRASHGCIRMHVPDVIDLYGRVPLGSTVLIR